MGLFPIRISGSLPARIRRTSIGVVASGVVALCTILFAEGTAGWHIPWIETLVYAASGVFVVVTLYAHFLRLDQSIYKWRYVRSAIPDGVLLLAMAAALTNPAIFGLASTVRIVYHITMVMKRTGFGRLFGDTILGSPEKATAFSFMAVIGLGTMLLMLPRSAATDIPVSFVDALFTATSAHCVTGLVVANTAIDVGYRTDLATFSTFGQIIILLLIQIGGIGIMTLSSASIAVMSGKLMPRERNMLDSLVPRDDGSSSISGMFRFIVFMTLSFEIVGTLILSLRFMPMFPGQIDKAVWFGLFHSVSAFCNAGFSLFSSNLMQFRSDPAVNLTIMTLIVFGGLGFPVIAVLFSSKTWGRGFRAGIASMPIHSRLVLRMTLLLIFGGAALLFLVDANGSQAGMTLSERIWCSFFGSVTARTAGFNTADMGLISRPAVLVYLLLMFIGASPGGTGGGIKTTTFALIVLSVKATMRRRAEIEVFRRSVGPRYIHNIVVVSFVALMACFVTTFLLTVLEPGLSIDRAAFETVSAFGTVGLSMNVSMDLHAPAKLLIVVLMYLGRIGPLTLTLALARKAPVGVSYPEGKILVG